MTRIATAPEAVLELVVARRTDEADGVVSLDLRRADGASLPAWASGAHIDLLLAPDLVRQYSLCSSPEEAEVWRVAVLREKDGRGGSLHVHDTLAEGDTVRACGPRNHFPLERAERYLFIAGGIGVTPIIPMLAEAERHESVWELAYGGRTRASMAF